MPDSMIRIWPDEAIEAMHLASLALLERALVRAESRAARELLLAAGCTAADGDRLLVPRRWSRTRWPRVRRRIPGSPGIPSARCSWTAPPG